jgi:hypothetical protein
MNEDAIDDEEEKINLAPVFQSSSLKKLLENCSGGILNEDLKRGGVMEFSSSKIEPHTFLSTLRSTPNDSSNSLPTIRISLDELK